MARWLIATLLFAAAAGCTTQGVCELDPADEACCNACLANPSRSWCPSTCAESSCSCQATDAGTDSGADAAATPDASACAIPCPGDQVCDPGSGQCVGCLGSGDCREPTPLCDTEDTRACVACLGHGDCDEPGAARCADGTCVQCNDQAQCVGIADAALCDSGTCVQCTKDDESACGGNSCDPATRTCTTTPRNMTETCEPCVADSECVADHRCIPLFFAGNPHGNYCMKIFSTGCSPPYVGTALMGRTSLSGVVEPSGYCPVLEASVSCEAIHALENNGDCTVDPPDGVGDPDLCMAEGALCRTVGGQPTHCTYSCTAAAQCPTGFACNSYCGG